MKYVGIIVCFLLVLTMFGQQDKNLVVAGNNLYYSGKYMEASQCYKAALKMNPSNKKAGFNYGNALYKTAEEAAKDAKSLAALGDKKDSVLKMIYGEAAGHFEEVANSGSSKDSTQHALYNLGNANLKQKDWDKAIEAYKKALRINPKDEDARYNLAYALKQKKKDDQKQNQQQQQQKQDKEQEKKEQQEQPKMTKEDAKRMLNALKQKEIKLQKDKKSDKEAQVETSVEKDW